MKKRRVRHDFLKELRNSSNIQVACDKVGISRNTYYRWRDTDAQFCLEADEALKKGAEHVDDVVESKFLGKINDGEWSPMKYYLDKRHPKYKTERQSTGGSGLSPTNTSTKYLSANSMRAEIERLEKKLEFEKILHTPVDPLTISSVTLELLKKDALEQYDKDIAAAKKIEQEERDGTRPMPGAFIDPRLPRKW